MDSYARRLTVRAGIVLNLPKIHKRPGRTLVYTQNIKLMAFKHCIFQITDQYALAKGDYDAEHYVCKMTNGKEKVLNDLEHQDEIEEFYEDEEEYWRKRGWVIIDKNGKRTLTPKHLIK